jgi:hypothetical protein
MWPRGQISSSPSFSPNTKKEKKKMSEKKRKIMEEWACPVCLETIGEGCVPAVMNGCTPFAHVACTKCLTALQAQNTLLCPKCRAPFSTFRPLADFVDTEDAEVASQLKKRRNSDSLTDRIDALPINDPVLKARVEWCAREFDSRVKDYPEVATESSVTWSQYVPEFDKTRVALTLADARNIDGFVCKRRCDLVSRLHALTQGVLPFLRILFPQYELRSAHHTDHGYFSIESTLTS